MTTEAFIHLLEQQDLVAPRVLRQLRTKLAEGDTRITPESILKYLVKKEHLSRAQAKDLLETTLVVSDKAESSILGLAPLADVPDAAPAKAPPPVQSESVFDPEPPRPASATPPPPSPRRPDDDLFAPLSHAAPSDPDDDDPLVPLDPVEQTALADAEIRRAPGSRLRTAARPKKNKKKPKAKRSASSLGKSEWDSPLLLLGGGGLAVLIVASLVLWFLVFRESADKALKLANDAFDRGAYAQAEDLYEAFVEKHTGHQSHSFAKIRQRMAPLWEAAESRNYAGAADMAPQVVAAIENEPAFSADASDPDGLSAAKRELSTLLTTIASGLAEQAEDAADAATAQARIAQLKSVLEMTANNKYVPPKLRLDSKLAEVAAALKRVEQRQHRDSDLQAALAAMDEALKRAAPAEAMAVRATLLTNHPVLVADQALAAKVVEISAAEKSALKFVEQRAAATTEPAPTPVVAELALADNRGEARPSGAAVQPVVVRVDGALFGLDAAGGALLWRRFVGFDGSAPATLDGGLVAAADAQHAELICLNASTGKLLWRQPLEGKLATPVPAGPRLLVASDAGKLFVLESASGELLGHIPFSQPLRTSPATNERGDRIYVLGDHSNLYTLSGADFSCLGVHYLGHATGGVTTPPVVVLNKVLVADNSGAETCLIRALLANDEGVVDAEAASHRLSGLVLTPLQVAGRRVAVASTLGQAAVFEISGAADKTALTLLAGREAQVQEPLAQFSLLHDGHLWVAGRQLTKLAVLPTGNQLPVRSLERDYRGDAFDYPLQVRDKLLIHVRRPAGRPGAIVAAVTDEATAVWETSLAAPPAGAPAVDESGLRITAGASSGLVFLLDREAMARRVQNQAARVEEPLPDAPPFTDSAALPRGRFALGGVGASRLLHFRPDDPRQQLHAVELPGPLACPPVAWGDGFVAATSVGQVALLSAEDASPLAAPFQPELTPGQELHWLRPAVAGAGAEARLAISDGAKKIYLLALQPSPQPHLAATASVDVGASPLTTPLAVAGARVFAGNAAGQLASFTLPDLAAGEPVALGGPVVWGPHAVGDGLLLSLESGELLLVGGDGAVRWRQPLKRGPAGGVPHVDGEQAFVLIPSAGVMRVSLADGAEAAFAELGQPAVAGPVAFGPRLVVAAPDGTLLVVNRP